MADPVIQVSIDAHSGQLHLQHGPIDLIINCDGSADARAAVYEAAALCFDGMLDQLVSELPLLRSGVATRTPRPVGSVAQRMYRAVSPFAEDNWVTPMAAVAGSVADSVGAAMSEAARLDRWMVNNGGDIAFGLADGQSYRTGLVTDPRRATIESTVLLEGGTGIGGIATSGRHGRSFSLGIADSVTVFAATAAAADVAATLIANNVDIGPHPAITRQPAAELDPDTDLGERLVTVDVGLLSTAEVAQALDNGLSFAERCLAGGLIKGAVLHLANQRVSVAAEGSGLMDSIGGVGQPQVVTA